jgi:hypothetical protein
MFQSFEEEKIQGWFMMLTNVKGSKGFHERDKDVLMLLRVIWETFLSTLYLCGKISSSKLSGKSFFDFISVTPDWSEIQRK